MKNTFPYHNSVNIRLAFPSTDLNKNAIELSNLQTFFLEQATLHCKYIDCNKYNY